MIGFTLKVDIDPRNIRSFRQLDIVLNELNKRIINGAAEMTSPGRITISLTVDDARVTA